MDGITKALNDRLETLLQNVDSMLSHNRMISQFFTKLEKGFFGKSALVRVGDMVFAADKTMGQILLEAFTRKPSFTNREIANRLRIHFPEETKSLIGVFNLEGIRGTGLSDDVFNMTRVEEIVQVLRESYFAGADVNPKPAEMLIQQIGEMSKRQNSELSISSASFAGMQNELTSRARDVRDFMKNMGDPSYVMNLTQDEAAAAMNDLRLRIGRLGRTLAEVQQTFDQSIGPAGKSVAV